MVVVPGKGFVREVSGGDGDESVWVFGPFGVGTILERLSWYWAANGTGSMSIFASLMGVLSTNRADILRGVPLFQGGSTASGGIPQVLIDVGASGSGWQDWAIGHIVTTGSRWVGLMTSAVLLDWSMTASLATLQVVEDKALKVTGVVPVRKIEG